jgi:glycosyltransferase domain-containing protein
MRTDDALTVLLTVRGRTAYTDRWMTYADAAGFPFQVLVADGGPDAATERLLSNRARFPRARYDFVRYPVDRAYAHFYAKIADALSRIQTPLTVLADNDDFFIVEGLRAAAAFLTDHPDYAACGGQEAGFWIAPNGGDPIYGSHVEWKWSADNESLDDDTACARLRRKSRKTTYATYYYVQRTEDLRRHFEAICRANPEDLFLFERFLAFLAAVAGKSKQLDQLYLARQHNAPGSSAIAHQSIAGDWLGRMLVPTWSADFTGFLEATVAALAARDGIPREQARACIVEAYRMEVAPMLLADLLKEATVTLPRCLTATLAREVLRLGPGHPVRRAARRLYRRLRWIPTDAVRGTECRARPVPCAAAAFKPVYDFLRRPAGPRCA